MVYRKNTKKNNLDKKLRLQNFSNTQNRICDIQLGQCLATSLTEEEKKTSLGVAVNLLQSLWRTPECPGTRVER